MKRVLEMHSGDGCMTIRMYLMSLNCTLKMAKMVNLMLCMFYHNLKITHTCSQINEKMVMMAVSRERNDYWGARQQGDLLPPNLLYYLSHSVLYT